MHFQTHVTTFLEEKKTTFILSFFNVLFVGTLFWLEQIQIQKHPLVKPLPVSLSKEIFLVLLQEERLIKLCIKLKSTEKNFFEFCMLHLSRPSKWNLAYKFCIEITFFFEKFFSKIVCCSFFAGNKHGSALLRYSWNYIRRCEDTQRKCTRR